MGLTDVDPERYGSLSHPGDTFSFDIYSQAGAVARGADGTVLAELPIERVIAIGESQSAMRLTTYINAVDAVAEVYDGFFVHARGRSGSPLDASGPMRDPSAPPEPFRDDLRVPVLCFQAETDLIVLGYYPARQPDNEHVPACGRWLARRTPTCTRSSRASSTAARSRSPSSRRCGRRRVRRWASSSTSRSTPDHSTTCSRPRSRTSTAGCATARRRPSRRASKSRTTTRPRVRRRRARQRARRHPHAARRRADRDAVGSRQQRRTDLDVVRHRRSRSARRSSRRSTRARTTTAPSSTPRPTPPSPPAGSSKPTPPRSKPSPPSSSPPRQRTCVTRSL